VLSTSHVPHVSSIAISSPSCFPRPLRVFFYCLSPPEDMFFHVVCWPFPLAVLPASPFHRGGFVILFFLAPEIRTISKFFSISLDFLFLFQLEVGHHSQKIEGPKPCPRALSALTTFGSLIRYPPLLTGASDRSFSNFTVCDSFSDTSPLSFAMFLLSRPLHRPPIR